MDNDYETKPFSLIFPKTSLHIKSYYGETKWMYILIEDDELFKRNIRNFQKLN